MDLSAYREYGLNQYDPPFSFPSLSFVSPVLYCSCPSEVGFRIRRWIRRGRLHRSAAKLMLEKGMWRGKRDS
uniref:Uncharacterized protein n=1 Tax=Picea glauca TaxID=3330 RepID=A0A117NFL9_PICGL|nr:hypothetical protein ABT39_MTgene2663 [Picea glauca]QHR92510.1 hypothetical protein Q903MT_gene6556 [Picea sitchensis]